MTERMAAIFGPASWLPICSQFSAAEHQGTHGVLTEVLIDLKATILEVNLQPCPLVEGILAGFCQVYSMARPCKAIWVIFALSSSKSVMLLC